MTEMSAPQKDAAGILLEYLERQRAEDRAERLRREAEERKEKSRARRPTYIRWGIVFLGLCLTAYSVLFMSKRADRFLDMLPSAPQTTYINTVKDWKGEAAILVIPIQGAITGHPLERGEAKGLASFFSSSENTVLMVKHTLQEASGMKNLAELVMFINSPGGGVSPAEEIFSMIKAWREKHPNIPVSAYFYEMAASGGYYIAMAADSHAAGTTTLVGSISVVMQCPNISKLAKDWGVDMTTIKSGPIKDICSMWRDMTEAERDVLQRSVDKMHGRFVDVIGIGRPKLSRSEIEKLADGSIFTAVDALEKGLIDRIAPTFDIYMAERAQSAMERLKVQKVHVVYPGTKNGAPEIELRPKQ